MSCGRKSASHGQAKANECGEQALPSPYLLQKLFCLLLLITELVESGDLEKARDYTDLDRKGFGGCGKKASRKGVIGSYWVGKGGNDG